MPGLIDAVCFDLDGTLVDSLDDITDAVNHVMSAHGFPAHDRDTCRMLVGGGARVLIERALPELARRDTDRYLAEFRERYFAHLTDRTAPYPGVAELLDELGRRNIPMAVLSNKPEALTRAVVERLLGSDRFQAVAGQREGIPRKPDPTGAIAIARALAVDPVRVAFVGDSAVDMDTGHAAGMIPVGVLWGYRDREELLSHGAAAVLAEPHELLALI